MLPYQYIYLPYQLWIPFVALLGFLIVNRRFEVVVSAYLVVGYWSYEVLFQFTGKPRPMIWILALLIIIGILVEYTFNSVPRNNKRKVYYLTIFLFVWLLYTFVNGLLINYNYSKFRIRSIALFFTGVIPAMGIYFSVRSVAKMRIFCISYVVFTLIISAYTFQKFPRLSYLDYANSDYLLNRYEYLKVNYLKYGRTACFASFISVILMIDVYNLQINKLKKSIICVLFLLCFLSLAAFTLWTGSRQSMLGLAFALLLTIVILGRKKSSILMTSIFAFAGLITIGYYILMYKSFILRIDDIDVASISRKGIWGQMYKIFLESPI
jgi:hypothetical protein